MADLEVKDGNYDVEKYPIMDKIRIDGGPENYKQLVEDYDRFASDYNWRGPESVISVWSKYIGEDLSVSESMPKHKVLDAGCGTGLVGVKLNELPNISSIEVYGGDLSPDMLAAARLKNISAYSGNFKIFNLKEPLPYKKGFFDSVISAGVFLHGHCGAECLPNIMEVLKEGGYFIVTVRYDFYCKTKPEWDQQIQECNCELVEESLVPYTDVARGTLLVLRKKLTT